MILLMIALIILIVGIALIAIGVLAKKRTIKFLGICVLLLLSIGFIIFYIYALEKDRMKLENQNSEIVEGTSDFMIPDRIIYKNSNSEYIMMNPEDKDFEKIYSELHNISKKNIEGVVYSEEELEKIQKEEKFIECDYNTKSKNYIFILKEKEISVIRRFDKGGQVIKNFVKDVDKLIKMIEDISLKYEKYRFDNPESYTSKTKIIDFSSNLKFEQKRDGIYQKIIKNNNNEFINILDELNFKLDNEIRKIDFDKENIIITISRYDIENIKANIGNIKYEFGKINNNYIVNVFIVSKISNVNCIYYNISDSDISKNNDLSKYVNITTSGMIQSISDNQIKIGLGNYEPTYIAKINENTFIMNYETNKEINLSDLKVGDLIYVEGETSIEIDGIKGMQANKIMICDKDRVKREISKNFIDSGKLEGTGIVYKSIDEDGNGYIIVEGNFDKFAYPIKINVNNQTETYLGMGYHLQSNYGYILHEMCDITIDKKITDIDNINGYATIIEYIAD